MSDFDYDKFDEMLQRHLDEMWRDPDDLEIGENISNIREIKIIFDGYGYDEETDEEGGNKNMESYAIFIHKDSAKEGFEFPEHDMTPWGLIHRTDEEVCIWAWYDVENDYWDINSMFDSNDRKLKPDEVMKILEVLDERYFGE